MSTPPPFVPPSQQRQSLDLNQRQIARVLLPTLENLTAFSAFLRTIPSGPPDKLTEEPYLYDADEAYALRLWGDLATLYAAIMGAGGTLDATQGKQLDELTRKSAGPPVYVNQGV